MRDPASFYCRREEAVLSRFATFVSDDSSCFSQSQCDIPRHSVCVRDGANLMIASTVLFSTLASVNMAAVPLGVLDGSPMTFSLFYSI